MAAAKTRVPHARGGVLGTLFLLAVLALALSGDTVTSLLGGRVYRAAFTEAGGLVSGDSVIVSGLPVGKVSAVTLAGDHVEVAFAVSDNAVRIGDRTRASIKAQTALGKKALELVPAGNGSLADNGEIPVTRTSAPYDVTEALSELTQTVSEVDTDRLAAGLNTVSETMSAASAEVRPALDGVRRLSDSIRSRDTELSQLLQHSANVTKLLAARKDQIQTLLKDGGVLLSELNSRGNAIAQLLNRATALSQQVSGLVADNRQRIGPALDQLNGTVKILQDNKASIDDALTQGVSLLRELGSVVASMPGFNVYIPNLAATNLVPTLPGLLTGGGR